MANSGKTVIVAALDGTFQRKVRCPGPGAGRSSPGGSWLGCPECYTLWLAGEARPGLASSRPPAICPQAFGSILNLVPLSESVVKLNAVCMECFREAAYTKRLGMEKEVAATGPLGQSGEAPHAQSQPPTPVLPCRSARWR